MKVERLLRRQGLWRAALCVAGVLTAVCSLSCEPIVLNFEGEGSSAGSHSGGAGATTPPDAPPAPELIVEEDFNLSENNLAPRRCDDGGEAVAYRVSRSQDAALTLERSPATGCLAPGDELLLIEVQGIQGSTERVGRQELLRALSIQDEVLTLTSVPTQAYGTGTIDEWEAGKSVILLQRVPNFSRVFVDRAATLTATAWQDGGSGVLALRAIGEAVIDGRISMNRAGYVGGGATQEANAHGQQGESIIGLGAAFIDPHQGGGGGGLGDQMESGCVQDGNAGGGGAHLENGGDAVINDLCEGEGRGLGGLAYAQAGKMFLGSGGGSGGMDNVTSDNPPGAPGGSGGGIVWLLAQSIGGSGSIESRGGEGVGDPPDVECLSGGSRAECYDHSGPGGGGAGGTVRLSAPRVSGVAIDVSGGLGGNGSDTAGGNGGSGARGVVEQPLG